MNHQPNPAVIFLRTELKRRIPHFPLESFLDGGMLTFLVKGKRNLKKGKVFMNACQLSPYIPVLSGFRPLKTRRKRNTPKGQI